MEIIELYQDKLYCIKYDGEAKNEYARIFGQWHDLDYLVKFFKDNASYIATPFWRSAGLMPDKPELSAQKIIDEANLLEPYIRTLTENADKDVLPDLDTYFHFLGGKYKCLWSLEPMKSYGTAKPSLLRLYAIKLDSNCYLIVYGGIKLGDTIQNSPGLKENVFRKIDEVLNYLRTNGIIDREDI